MDELIAYMVGTNAPNELKNVAIEKMQAVEELNQSGATAFLIIAETQAEANQVETEYALSNCVPELDELFTCHNVQKGDCAGGQAPYGLKIVNKQYEIDEDEAPAVRLIFSMTAKRT